MNKKIVIETQEFPENEKSTQLILFRKQINPVYKDRIYAWQVIDLKPNMKPIELAVDDYYEARLEFDGNYSGRTNVQKGTAYKITKSESTSANIISYDKPAFDKNDIVITNRLFRGAYDIGYLYSGKFIYRAEDLVPQQSFDACFSKYMHLSVVSGYNIQEGQQISDDLIISTTEYAYDLDTPEIKITVCYQKGGNFNLEFSS